MNDTVGSYGSGDSTFEAAGGIEGLSDLVNRFYYHMDHLTEAKGIREMHPQDLSLSKQKLTYFLSGWMGGPKLYAEHFGSITLPVSHSHLPIDENSKNVWLHCMALADQGYPEDFRHYVLGKLAIPAESIRLMCEFKADPKM